MKDAWKKYGSLTIICYFITINSIFFFFQIHMVCLTIPNLAMSVKTFLYWAINAETKTITEKVGIICS